MFGEKVNCKVQGMVRDNIIVSIEVGKSVMAELRVNFYRSPLYFYEMHLINGSECFESVFMYLVLYKKGSLHKHDKGKDVVCWMQRTLFNSAFQKNCHINSSNIIF